MKKACLISIAVVLLSVMVFSAAKSQARIAGRITKVELFASQSVFKGCSNTQKLIKFTALVTASGACNATYKWLRSDGGIDGLAPRKLNFTSAGTQTVSTSWTMTVAEYEGWQAVEFMKPNSITSNKANFSIYCCKAGNTCAENPFTLSGCGLDMLNTFRNLVRGVGTRICNTTIGSVNVSSVMNASCYGNTPGVTGPVSYTSFYIPSDTAFRVIWGSAANNNLAYNYYGACAPEPIIFPAVGENHVYEAFLIPVSDYAASLVKTNYAQLKKKAIKATAIADLTGWYYEPISGYISTTESANYNNIFSSKGLVVKTRLKSGTQVLCYLINNYDLAGTVTWKDKNMCPSD